MQKTATRCCCVQARYSSLSFLFRLKRRSFDVEPYTTHSQLFAQSKSQQDASPHRRSETILIVLVPLRDSEAACQTSPRSQVAGSQNSSPSEQMETRKPSFQALASTAPANPQKALPPDPPIQDASSVRCSSSLYTPATGIWDEEQIISSRSNSERQNSNITGPQTLGSLDSPLTPESAEMIDPVPPLLQPRGYSPLLPSPSPSLAPQSRANSYIPPLQTNLSLRGSEHEDDGLASLAVSPPLSPIQPTCKFPQPSVELPSQHSTALLALVRTRSASPLSSRLSRPFCPSVDYKSEESISKTFASLGVTTEEFGASRGRQRKETIPSRSLENIGESRLHFLNTRVLIIF
jgi:hypothetical protein